MQKTVQSMRYSLKKCIKWEFMDFELLLPNKSIDLAIASSIPLRIYHALIALDILHMFFNMTTREMIAFSTVLDPLSIFLRED